MGIRLPYYIYISYYTNNSEGFAKKIFFQRFDGSGLRSGAVFMFRAGQALRGSLASVDRGQAMQARQDQRRGLSWRRGPCVAASWRRAFRLSSLRSRRLSGGGDLRQAGQGGGCLKAA